MINQHGQKIGPPQGLERGEKLRWKNEETRVLGLTHLIQKLESESGTEIADSDS